MIAKDDANLVSGANSVVRFDPSRNGIFGGHSDVPHVATGKYRRKTKTYGHLVLL